MSFSKALIRISEPILTVKKIALINDWGNLAYWEGPAQSKVLTNKFSLFQAQLRVLGGVAAPGKFWNFSPHLSSERVFPAFKLTQNCYININISFS